MQMKKVKEPSVVFMNELSQGSLEVYIAPVGGEVGVRIYGFTFRPFSVCMKQSSAVHIFLPSQVLLRRMLVLRKTILKETKYSVIKCYLLGLGGCYLLGLRGYFKRQILLLMSFSKSMYHLSGGGVGNASVPPLECQLCQECVFLSCTLSVCPQNNV